MRDEKEHTFEKISSLEDIDQIITPEGALYASNGEMYKSMLFGRDALEAADDLVQIRPKISENVLIRLAQLQGSELRDENAEEVGKIPHQHMQLYINGERIPHTAEEQMQRLSARWGGTKEGFTYFGSLDATPLFARLAARHTSIHGAEIMNSPILHQNGEVTSFMDSFVSSLNWISKHLEMSELGLLEFRRLNDRHIVIQSWRDSGSGFIHTDGSQANLNGFIAPLEVQGYAYDALKIASLLGRNKVVNFNDSDLDKWEYQAKKLQQTVIDMFWMNDGTGFAMGIDRDENWQPRQIQTLSSSQGVLLDSRLLLDLDEDRRRHAVEVIVKSIMSDNFLTDAGIRCRANEHSSLVDFADYHGSQAVWAKETYDISKGLRRQGMPRVAAQLDARLLNMINISGAHYEFLYVVPSGDVDYNPKNLATLEQTENLDGIIAATNIPDLGQAWTISASLAVKNSLHPRNRAHEGSWTKLLEDQVLSSTQAVQLLKTREEIESARQASKNFAIDVAKGIEADKKWNPSWWSD
jgi:hypothetical protein